ILPKNCRKMSAAKGGQHLNPVPLTLTNEETTKNCHPAVGRIHRSAALASHGWVPACAGTTKEGERQPGRGCNHTRHATACRKDGAASRGASHCRSGELWCRVRRGCCRSRPARNGAAARLRPNGAKPGPFRSDIVIRTAAPGNAPERRPRHGGRGAARHAARGEIDNRIAASASLSPGGVGADRALSRFCWL